MTISLSKSEMERVESEFASHAETVSSSLESLSQQLDTLFASWIGTGSGSMKTASGAVEKVLSTTSMVFAGLGTQIGGAAQTFDEADRSAAAGISGAGE